MRNALVVALVFFCLCVGFGQHFTIQGTVTNEDGKPLEDITIALEGFDTLVFTDDKGSFFLDSVPRGEHTLLVDWFSTDFISFDFILERDTIFTDPFIVKDKSVYLDEVVVTEKAPVRESIESLPALEINADEIRKEIGGSLIQSLEKIPGIKSINIGSSNAKPLIRGLGFNQVAVVENGIKHEGQEWGADHGLEIDQYNVDRLEIIKGPTSFLYGSDALGGIINIESNRVPPENSFGGNIDITGKTNNLHAGGSLNLFGRKEKWFFDLRSTAASYADYRVPADTVHIYSYAVGLDKHFVRNTAGSQLDNSLYFGYSDARIKSILSVSRNFNKSGFFANAHGIAPINVDKTVYDASNRDVLLPYQQVTHTKVSHHTDLHFKNHHIFIDWGFQRNFRNEFSKYVAHGYMPPLFPEWLNIPSDLEREYDKNVGTINISDKVIIKKHSLRYGINQEFQQNKIDGWGFLIPAYKSYNAGGYVFDKYFINDHLTLLGALRYDFASLHIDSYHDWFESSIEKNGKSEKEKLQKVADFAKAFHNLSWSAGLIYTKNNWSLNANIGKSFRMPIAKELAANGVNYHYFRYEQGNNQLSPEQSYQLDLGIRWTKGKVKMNATPFVNYFSNYIFLNPTSEYDTYYGAGNQIFEYTQAKVFRTGFEWEAEYQAFQQLKIESGIEYLFGIQLSGAKIYYPLPFTPPGSGIFSIIYEPNIWEKSLTNSFIKLDLKIAVAQNEIVPPEKKTPGYNVWGLSVGTSVKTKNKSIDTSLNIYNLWNQKYLNHTSFYRLIELPEQGRNIVLSLKIPF